MLVLVLSPLKKIFKYYLGLLKIPSKTDLTYLEQNLLNYAYPTNGRSRGRALALTNPVSKSKQF